MARYANVKLESREYYKYCNTAVIILCDYYFCNTQPTPMLLLLFKHHKKPTQLFYLQNLFKFSTSSTLLRWLVTHFDANALDIMKGKVWITRVWIK